MRLTAMPDHQYHTTLDWQERALHYGDGLFETLLKTAGSIPYWKAHYQRMVHGCNRLSIVSPVETWLKRQVEKKSAAYDTAVIKIIVSRGIGGRGLQFPEPDKPSIFVLAYPYQPGAGKPIKVALCKTPLPINPVLAGLKHLNRLNYVLAASELRQRVDVSEGIVLDTDGYLVEGLISNLFFSDGDRVFTPALDRSGVEGIMRGIIIRRLGRMDIPLETGRFTTAELIDASESFMCNSVRGIMPIGSMEHHRYAMGALTRRLIAEIAHPG